MVSHGVTCFDVNAARFIRLWTNTFSTHQHIVAQHHGIAFVVLRRQRIIEVVPQTLAERFARPQRDTRHTTGTAQVMVSASVPAIGSRLPIL